MRFYFSKILKIEDYKGIHFLQDHIGTNYRSPWNDYSFITTFNVYAVLDSHSKYFMGEVKVLAKGASNTAVYFSETGLSLLDEKIFEITDVFNSSSIVSLAVSISYYQKIFKLFDSRIARDILERTCDASYHSNNIFEYRKWPGFKESLLRNGSSSEAILKKGFSIALGRYSPEDRFEIEMDFPDVSIESINFKFSNQKGLDGARINILIGKNGTGKTYILRRLTELITGVVEDENKWPYFNKLLVAAYSPFEDFYTKTSLLEALENSDKSNATTKQPSSKSLKRKLIHINNYEYIGFRNKDGEFSLDWPKEHSALSILKILELDLENKWWLPESRLGLLFDTLRLCIDFDSIVLRRKDLTELRLQKEGISTKKELNSTIATVDTSIGILFEKDNKLIPLSSGQKIYSYFIPCIIAEIEDESLLIIDEPELCLHPALEIGLINMLKSLLAGTSSYAIVATHSAVMAREVDRTSIRILKKSEEITEIHNPTFQTLGESLELIIGEAFDDFMIQKPYQQELDALIASSENRDSFLGDISDKVGDEGLAYALSKYASIDADDISLEQLDATS
jgi:ABC-type Mn2+/Zn2+ transport system ATPase subunit